MAFLGRRARHPGPPFQPQHFSLEFHNVGGWLTHGDLALGAGVDFLAVAEHRLIPARVRGEWSRLGVRVFPLFGLRLRRFPLMLVTRGWSRQFAWRSPCFAFFCYCSV